MEKLTGLLGIISLCLVGVQADIDYSKPKDFTVRILTQDQQVVPGQKNVKLSCMGWSDNLGDYISNRVCWTFVKFNGERNLLTEGFYATTKEDPNNRVIGKKFDNKEYMIAYNDTKYFIFTLTIAEIKHSDDGEYICELVDGNDKVNFTTKTSLTVLNPVEKVTLEVHNKDTHAVIVKKTVPADKSDIPVELTPGKYMIDCVAKGSNPEPVMTFMYNEEDPSVLVTTVKETSGDRVQYSGNIRFAEFNLKAMGTQDQYLTCSANIPGNRFDPKVAGLKVHVKVDIPDVECENTSRMVGDHYGRLVCNVTAAGGKCDMVKWIIGGQNIIIDSNSQYGDEDQTYDVITTECNAGKKSDVLQVSLEVNKMKPVHFNTVFYLSYGIGNDAHRVPVQFTLKPGSSSIISPLSLFVYLALALVSRQVMLRF